MAVSRPARTWSWRCSRSPSAQRGVEAGGEERVQAPGHVRVGQQGVRHEFEGVGVAHLPHVLGVGAQHDHLAPVHALAQHQPVEAVRFHDAGHGRAEGLAQQGPGALRVHPGRVLQAEVVEEEVAVVGRFDLEGAFVQDLEAEVVEVRQDLAQALGLEHVQLDPGVLLEGGAGALGQVDVHARLLPARLAGALGGAVLLEAGDVLQRVLDFVVDAVAGRERLGPDGGEFLGAVLAVGAGPGAQHLGDALAPGAGGADQALLQLVAVDVADVRVLGQPDPEEQPGQGGFGHPRLIVDRHGVEGLPQFLLDAQPDVGGVPVAGQVDEGGHEPAVDVRAEEQPGPAALLQPLDAGGDGGEVRDFDLEELIARIGLQDAEQVLAGVGVRREAGIAAARRRPFRGRPGCPGRSRRRRSWRTGR